MLASTPTPLQPDAFLFVGAVQIEPVPGFSTLLPYGGLTGSIRPLFRYVRRDGEERGEALPARVHEGSRERELIGEVIDQP